MQLAIVLAGLALIHAGIDIVRLGLFKVYTIDEFQYAHASWAIANGQVPYRDFFEHHFPLLYQLLSPLWLLMDDHPGNIRTLRVVMLGIVALTALCVARVNRTRGWIAALLAPAILLATLPYAHKATEIRPDSLGTALFVGSIAALCVERWAPRTRAFVCGLVFTLAVWSTQKAFYFGLIYPVALLVDLARYRSRRFLLADPFAFVAGSLVVLLPIAAYLTLTGSWEAWWNWTIRWSFVHQDNYPGWGWERVARHHVANYALFELLAVVGVVASLRRGERKPGPIPPEGLAVAALGTSILSFAAQRAPGGYSLIVVAAFVALFAARGVQWLWDLAARRRLALVAHAALILLLAWSFVQAQGFRVKHLRDTNTYQHTVFDEIDVLTDPGDSVYDNSGSYVSRPHSSFFFYTDRLLRQRVEKKVSLAASEGIIQNETVMFLRDKRGWVSPQLGRFLRRNFQPYSGDLYLWGRKLEFPDGEPAEFVAVTKGRYFLFPEAALGMGTITIDGEPVTEPVFELARGPHEVEYQGPMPHFFVLWLPRNGERYEPRWGEPRRFSRVY